MRQEFSLKRKGALIGQHGCNMHADTSWNTEVMQKEACAVQSGWM